MSPKINKGYAMNFNSLISLMEYYKDENTCIEHFKKIRFANGVYCPCCGQTQKVYELKDKKTYKCNMCNNKFSLKKGTIFEGSNIPLRKWFIAIYLHINHSKGISSVQLSKDINVTQKTAWFILNRLREVETRGFIKQSIAEIDETYVGVKKKINMLLNVQKIHKVEVT